MQENLPYSINGVKAYEATCLFSSDVSDLVSSCPLCTIYFYPPLRLTIIIGSDKLVHFAEMLSHDINSARLCLQIETISTYPWDKMPTGDSVVILCDFVHILKSSIANLVGKKCTKEYS